MDREKGSIYGLHGTCMKTGRHVLEIMREKHPEHTTLVEVDFNVYNNVNLLELLEPMSLLIFKENVSSAARKLHGGASLCGVTGC